MDFYINKYIFYLTLCSYMVIGDVFADAFYYGAFARFKWYPFCMVNMVIKKGDDK